MKIKRRLNFKTRLIFLRPSHANFYFLFSNFAVRQPLKIVKFENEIVLKVIAHFLFQATVGQERHVACKLIRNILLSAVLGQRYFAKALLPINSQVYFLVGQVRGHTARLWMPYVTRGGSRGEVEGLGTPNPSPTQPLDDWAYGKAAIRNPKSGFRLLFRIPGSSF